MSNITLKAFDENDWAGFAGATGSPKISAQIEAVGVLSGVPYDYSILFITDDEGLHAYEFNVDGDPTGFWTLEVNQKVADTLVATFDLAGNLQHQLDDFGARFTAM